MYQLYNVLLAFWPILWFGLFDKSTSADRFYEDKALYRSFHFGEANGLSFKKYITVNAQAVLASFLIFFLV